MTVAKRYSIGANLPYSYDFKFGPSEEVSGVSGWTVWKASIGWRAEFRYYDGYGEHLFGARLTTWRAWSPTRRGVRNKIARQLRKWRKREHRFLTTREH